MPPACVREPRLFGRGSGSGSGSGTWVGLVATEMWSSPARFLLVVTGLASAHSPSTLACVKYG
eukprot:scaffold81902_cov67-Phaeocystis_antarctica.AAC.5